MTRALRSAAVAGVALLPAACITPPPPPDYTAYVAHMPRSILVLPPVNESIEVQAGEALLSCLTVPLAEMGYYVFPVAAVEDTLRRNGVPEPADMHQVPPDKLRSVFGCDAVLYVADDVATGARVALGLAEAGGREEDVDVPPVRVSLVWGRVLSRFGDVFGPSVNLAARLVDIAEPTTVLVDRDTAGLLASDQRFALTAQPETEVQGLGTIEPVRLQWAYRG